MTPDSFAANVGPRKSNAGMIAAVKLRVARRMESALIIFGSNVFSFASTISRVLVRARF
jgi:hypothetical protein